MGFDTAYEAIAEEVTDHRWAFGTGFSDPLDGVDTAVPAGMDWADRADLGRYCEMLADDALVMSQRLCEWITRAPELEEETALANFALDLLGQARFLYARAGAADGTGRDEDDFAYVRSADEFRNVRLVEAVDDDFAVLIVRLLVFSSWRLALVNGLATSRDPVLAAVAAKAVNEVTYHRDYAAQWLVRLGDGTELSHRHAAAALVEVFPLYDELFRCTEIEARLATAEVAVDPAAVRIEVNQVLGQVLAAATLTWPELPDQPAVAGPLGRDGAHTAAMGELVAELQSVARAYPGARW
jgi:ring-1,2-phenylacetyl-CoA epoxidase subunit PaaC